MYSEFFFDVRGYELDSFGHVNNSVYLNYLEQARWKFFKENGFYEFLRKHRLHPVVTEVKMRFIRELKVFEEAVVKSNFANDGNFILAHQNIYLLEKKTKVAKAVIEMILLSQDRLVYDLPQFIKEGLQGEG